MTLGDDERRQKSQRHREAAFSRWEDRGERAARRTTERTVDGLDRLLRGVMWVVMLPVRGVALLVGSIRSGGRAGRSWRR